MKVGRPLIFKTVEELQEKIDEYFAYCENRIKTIWDDKANKEQVINYPAPYTMHGLARALGVDRQTVLNYEERDQFFGAIKAAREKIAEDVETRLMDGKVQAGAIFNLKNNFGWKDETQTQISGTFTINIDEVIGLSSITAQATEGITDALPASV